MPVHALALGGFIALTAASLALSTDNGAKTPNAASSALPDIPAEWSGCSTIGSGGATPDLASYTEGRIAFLRAELNITAMQDTVWQDYSDALRARAESMDDMHRQMAFSHQAENPSMLQTLDLRIRMMRPYVAALEALRPASAELYRTLSPEQRVKADRIVPVMGCM